MSCYQNVGYVSNELDCNDNDPEINPNAIELCDGIDNNCDSFIDEGFNTSVYYMDNDGDGYGDNSNSFITCDTMIGVVKDNTDCDDNNPDINPAATEIIGNGIDENCDGRDNTTSVNNPDVEKIIIYPNPSSSTLTIQGINLFSAALINIKGEVLLNSSDNKIEISHLPSGIYMLHIISNDGNSSIHKIIKS